VFIVILVLAMVIAIGLYLLKGNRGKKKDEIHSTYLTGPAVLGVIADSEPESEMSDYSMKEEMRNYSIGSVDRLSDVEDEKRNYSIEYVSDNDLKNKDLDAKIDVAAEEEEILEKQFSSRLKRLGQSGEDNVYGSTKTHRDSFHAEIDLDKTRPDADNKPQTFGSVKGRTGSKEEQRTGSTRYNPSSTRVGAAISNRDMNTRTTMSSTRRLES